MYLKVCDLKEIVKKVKIDYYKNYWIDGKMYKRNEGIYSKDRKKILLLDFLIGVFYFVFG